MPLYFRSVRTINLSADHARSGVDIYFERADAPPPADSKVESLRREYEEAIFVLQSMAIDDNTFTSLFNPLARRGKDRSRRRY